MSKAPEQKFGGRKWVKLWVNEWLDGTTRYQMSDGQRAFWIDLLALAGRSRFPGVVCSGRDGEQWIGYPLQKFQGMLSDPIDVPGTFDLFTRTDKITIAISPDGKLYTLFISNWDKYQSEYERIKKYTKTTPKLQKKYALEVEGEVEIEGEVEKQCTASQCVAPKNGASAIDLLAPRELKGLRTTLQRSLRSDRVPGGLREQLQKQLREVNERLQ